MDKEKDIKLKYIAHICSLILPSPSPISHSTVLLSQVSKTGQVLQSEIVGSVKMKVKLTGMPELRLGLNDKVLFQNTGSEWCLCLCVYLTFVDYYSTAKKTNQAAGKQTDKQTNKTNKQTVFICWYLDFWYYGILKTEGETTR